MPSLPHWLPRIVLPTVATAAGVTCGVVGLLVVFSWPRLDPKTDREIYTLAGVVLMSIGQFIFAVTTANRLFPGADQRLTAALEVGSLLTFVGAVGGLLWIA